MKNAQETIVVCSSFDRRSILRRFEKRFAHSRELSRWGFLDVRIFISCFSAVAAARVRSAGKLSRLRGCITSAKSGKPIFFFQEFYIPLRSRFSIENNQLGDI